MISKLTNDSRPLSDDELAVLERALESADESHPELDSPQQLEHRTAFMFIHELSAPIRTAIESLDSPPLLEDYDELTEIARGGMGVVYRGLHKKTQRFDAVKVMRPDRLVGTAHDTVGLLRMQFLRESQLAARVAHEHIVPVYQVGESGDRPWFSMQLVDGRSLHEITRNSLISPERIVRYLEQIARAVDVVHRHGILHGDIKPQNILIESRSDRPMISDFGLAALDATVRNTPEAGIAGTPAYMAPELAHAAITGRSQDDINASRTISSDVYSLGATLWAALSGCSPCIEDRTPSQQLADVAAGKLRFEEKVSRDIPPALLGIIYGCVSRDAANRFATAGEFADELAKWLDRPSWNRHFPRLRYLLCIVVAPVLVMSGVAVQWLLYLEAAKFWMWFVVFGGYVPLFATFLASQEIHQRSQQARRELWSIWIGHLCASFAGMIVLHILCQPEGDRISEFFYPFWALISSLLFFSKSGNFWFGYRWLGVAWSVVAIWLSLMPAWAPILFGVLAATTCFVTATMDRSFVDD